MIEGCALYHLLEQVLKGLGESRASCKPFKLLQPLVKVSLGEPTQARSQSEDHLQVQGSNDNSELQGFYTHPLTGVWT